MAEHSHVHLPENANKGPVKWHKTCGRKHAVREDCDLETVTKHSRKRLNDDGTVRRGGNEVVRLVHKPKATKKTKARKS